ncbi:hypothetical protein PoB_002357700 [Plakobranchus ocellatus]|uniref:Uncharacterized protein n=1 Tax=Plakobranchus ocellatus TaxID=259542 RepID=A0AAV3ZRC5_9GAST|nr:hypothetical protein PoB_002357700 [Plakobranchus ocellatus]
MRVSVAGATFLSTDITKALATISVLVLLSCLSCQHSSVNGQWTRGWRSSSLAGRDQMSSSSRSRGLGSWRRGMLGGEDAEEWQEEMEERGGMRGGMGEFMHQSTGDGSMGGSSAEGGMEEMPSWLQYLRSLLRSRIQMWRQYREQLEQQQQQQQSQQQQQQQQPQEIPPSQPQTMSSPNSPSVLPDASFGPQGSPLGSQPVSRLGRPPMPTVPQSQSLPVPPEASPTTSSTTGGATSEVIDLNMSVDDDVRPAGGFALKMWLCDQEGGVCAYQCENPSDTIDTVDCGSGPQGKLYCCDQ